MRRFKDWLNEPISVGTLVALSVWQFVLGFVFGVAVM